MSAAHTTEAIAKRSTRLLTIHFTNIFSFLLLVSKRRMKLVDRTAAQLFHVSFFCSLYTKRYPKNLAWLYTKINMSKFQPRGFNFLKKSSEFLNVLFFKVISNVSNSLDNVKNIIADTKCNCHHHSMIYCASLLSLSLMKEESKCGILASFNVNVSMK
jgi:hypothetical protein